MTIEKRSLITLEEEIIKSLDFDLTEVLSIDFLERYLRLFGIDQEREDTDAFQIAVLAREFCRYMLKNSNFLKFKPS